MCIRACVPIYARHYSAESIFCISMSFETTEGRGRDQGVGIEMERAAERRGMEYVAGVVSMRAARSVGCSLPCVVSPSLSLTLSLSLSPERSAVIFCHAKGLVACQGKECSRVGIGVGLGGDAEVKQKKALTERRLTHF